MPCTTCLSAASSIAGRAASYRSLSSLAFLKRNAGRNHFFIRLLRPIELGLIFFIRAWRHACFVNIYDFVLGPFGKVFMRGRTVKQAEPQLTDRDKVKAVRVERAMVDFCSEAA